MKKEVAREGANRSRFYLFVFVVFVLFFSVLVSAATFSDCGTLSSANTIYNLTGNLINGTKTGNCLTVSAQNITIDCQGYYILALNASNGVYSNQYNTTVKNCNITTNRSAGSAVWFNTGANNGYVYNNTFNNQKYGVALWGAAGTEVTNNIIDLNIISNNSLGIIMYYTKFNQINSNALSLSSPLIRDNYCNSYNNNFSSNTLSGSINSGYHDFTICENNSYIYNNTFISSGASIGAVSLRGNNITVDSNYVASNLFSTMYFNLLNNSNIINNLFFNNGSSASASIRMYDGGNSYNLLIKNNTFNSSVSAVGMIIGRQNGTSNWTIQNNIFTESNGIYLTGISNINILYNDLTWTGNKAFGFSIFNSNKINMTSNILGNTNNYINATDGLIFAYGNNTNITVSYNIGYMCNGTGIDVSESNYTVLYNNQLYYNCDVSSALGIACGRENGIMGEYSCLMSNNYFSAPVSSVGKHNYFLGYSYNSTFVNNTAVGGGYGLVAKSNSYANVVNNYFYNNSVANIHNKGDMNGYYANNYLYQGINNYIHILTWMNPNLVDISNQNGINSTFLDNILVDGPGTTGIIQVKMNGNSTNIIINSTYNSSAEVFIDTNNTLTRKWYYSTFVNDTDGNVISSANVSIYDNSGSLVFSSLTNSSGLIGQQILTEYFANSTNKYYSTNYTLNISKEGYSNYSTSINLTTNINSIITLAENIAPNITLVSPINSYSETSSSSTINFQFNVSDESNLMNCTVYLNGVSYSNTSAVSKSATNIIPISVTPNSYSWYVNCTDSLGNIGNSTTNFFTIIEPVVVSSGSGSPVLYIHAQSLVNGYSKVLMPRWQIKFKLGSDNHSMYLNNVSNKSATFTIFSTPQVVSLNVGEERKLSLTNSSYYDLYVKLNSVYQSKANFTIKSINETVYVAPTPIVQNNTVTNVTPEKQRSYVVEYIIGGLFIVGLVIFIIYGKNYRRFKF